MIVFLRTFWNMMIGISLVIDTREHNLPAEDLSIRLELLPGMVRRKWIEKKRKMQRIARENFQGMELYPNMPDIADTHDAPFGEWTLPKCHTAVQRLGETPRPKGIYHVPPALLKEPISRDQLQRLMDEDSTLPILLGSKGAVDVIRKFREAQPQDADDLLATGDGSVSGTDNAGQQSDEKSSPLKRLQGYVFGKIDELEKVKLDGEVPEVPEIDELTEDMSSAITDVRNQFRLELTGIIEATASLFQYLLELTQSLGHLRQNNEGVIAREQQRALRR